MFGLRACAAESKQDAAAARSKGQVARCRVASRTHSLTDEIAPSHIVCRHCGGVGTGSPLIQQAIRQELTHTCITGTGRSLVHGGETSYSRAETSCSCGEMACERTPSAGRAAASRTPNPAPARCPPSHCKHTQSGAQNHARHHSQRNGRSLHCCTTHGRTIESSVSTAARIRSAGIRCSDPRNAFRSGFSVPPCPRWTDPETTAYLSGEDLSRKTSRELMYDQCVRSLIVRCMPENIRAMSPELD